MKAFLIDHLLHALETLAEALAIGLLVMLCALIGMRIWQIAEAISGWKM